jgi:hypothetical protein
MKEKKTGTSDLFGISGLLFSIFVLFKIQFLVQLYFSNLLEPGSYMSIPATNSFVIILFLCGSLVFGLISLFRKEENKIFGIFSISVALLMALLLFSILFGMMVRANTEISCLPIKFESRFESVVPTVKLNTELLSNEVQKNSCHILVNKRCNNNIFGIIRPSVKSTDSCFYLFAFDSYMCDKITNAITKESCVNKLEYLNKGEIPPLG